MRIVGIAGSLRRHSYNHALLRAAARLVPEGVTLDVRTIAGIPLYDGDEEAEHGIPPTVAELKEAIASSDGVILATPEYNNSVPGAFKNATDWASRPPSDIPRVFGNRPFAVLGTSPSPFGTILAQNAWLPVLRMLGTRPWFGGRFVLPQAADVFDGEGNMKDEPSRERLRVFVHGFCGYIRSGRE